MNQVSTENELQIDQVARYLLDQGRFPAKARILHIGCGDGAILSKLSELRPDLHCAGIAEHEDDVLEARRRLSQGQFAVANLAEKMPFKDPFDLVISYGLAQRFPLLRFVELNERLSHCLMPHGILHHFSVLNAKQSFQYNLQKWQSSHGAALGAVIGGVDGLWSKVTRKYDSASFWHDPETMQGSLQHLGTVRLRIPADAWHRFDIKILL